MMKYGNVLRVVELLWERQQLNTDTPIGSTELRVICDYLLFSQRRFTELQTGEAKTTVP